MWMPSTKYLYGMTSSFGVSVNVSHEAEAAVDAEIRAAQQDHAHEVALTQKRRAFHALLVDPQTAIRLDAMLADNARIDARLREDDRLDAERDGQDGNRCGPGCSFCGRCD